MKEKLTIIIILLSSFMVSSCSHRHWSVASRESAGIAKPPAEQTASIYQIYTARAYNWRGNFAVHPWIAWKQPHDKQYKVVQVTAWSIRRQGTSISMVEDLPDRYWYDSPPTLIYSVEGKTADKIIAQTQTLIKKYPYKDTYRLFPGPNSNTFVDYIIRNIPELTVELPPHAIGKDYLVDSYVLDWSPSGKGVQFSLFGILGFTLGLAEGIELNLLGLNFGIDFYRPALKLPFVGRLGFSDEPL